MVSTIVIVTSTAAVMVLAFLLALRLLVTFYGLSSSIVRRRAVAHDGAFYIRSIAGLFLIVSILCIQFSATSGWLYTISSFLFITLLYLSLITELLSALRTGRRNRRIVLLAWLTLLASPVMVTLLLAGARLPAGVANEYGLQRAYEESARAVIARDFELDAETDAQKSVCHEWVRQNLGDATAFEEFDAENLVSLTLFWVDELIRGAMFDAAEIYDCRFSALSVKPNDWGLATLTFVFRAVTTGVFISILIVPIVGRRRHED